MREAIGGSWLFGIVALFIVLFSGFFAYSVNYTKAFNAKNQIINIIERDGKFVETDERLENLSDDQLQSNKSTEAKIYLYIKQSGYNTEDVQCDADASLRDGGYCLSRTCSSSGKPYYKVTTFIKLTIPIIDAQINIPISGETKTLYYDNKCEKIN